MFDNRTSLFRMFSISVTNFSKMAMGVVLYLSRINNSKQLFFYERRRITKIKQKGMYTYHYHES